MFNPIIVKNNNKVVKFINIDCKYNKLNEELKVEIHNSKGKILYNDYIKPNNVIEIQQSENAIDIYFKNKQNEIVGIQSEDLYKKNILSPLSNNDENDNKEEEHLLKELQKEVISTIDNIGNSSAEKDYHVKMLKESTSKRESRTYVTEKIRQIIEVSPLVKGFNPEKINELTYILYSDLYGMGVIQELDDDDTIQEILVNAIDFPTFSCQIYYYKDGIKYPYTKRNFKNIGDLMKIFNRAIEFDNKQLNNNENSRVEAIRANKDRVNITIPCASENYSLNIRKFSSFVPNPEMMKKVGTVNKDIEKYFEVFVKGNANIGIGGAMKTGKTTLINYLLTYTPPIQRKVVIASVSETDTQRVLKGHDIVVYNVNDEKGHTFQELIKTSLRSTADRVIIPESRGGEFKQVYEASIKTQGNMFTAHALEDSAFLDICVDMYLESAGSTNESSQYILNKLAKSINVIVIMRNVNGKIRIKSITEVIVNENGVSLNPLYVFKFNPDNPNEGYYESTGNKISNTLRDYLNENGVPLSELQGL